jgi:hypothetical protein
MSVIVRENKWRVCNEPYGRACGPSARLSGGPHVSSVSYSFEIDFDEQVVLVSLHNKFKKNNNKGSIHSAHILS